MNLTIPARASADVTRAFLAAARSTPDWKYTDAIDVFYPVQLGVDSFLAVVGDGANGSYEWVWLYHGAVKNRSNVGFGDSLIALKKGLEKCYE